MDPDRPGPGAILGGIFMILFGLCLLLAGGACTILWSDVLLHDPGSNGDGIVLLLVSIFIAGSGILFMVQGVRMLRGSVRRP